MWGGRPGDAGAPPKRRRHGVRYLNTPVEVWDPYDAMEAGHPLDRTLYVRHMELRGMIAGWGDDRGPRSAFRRTHMSTSARDRATRSASSGPAWKWGAIVGAAR